MSKLWIFVAIAFVPLVIAYPFISEEDASYQVNLNMESDDSSVTTDDDDYGNDVKFELDNKEEWVIADGEGIVRSMNPYRLYRGQSHFALSMLKAMTKQNPQNNQIFSPHSTYRALLIAYFGTEGQSMKSLGKSMYMDWADDKKYNARSYKAELMARSERFLGQGLQFNSVDRLYVSKEVELKSHITDLFTDSIKKVDFTDAEARRQEINAWVEEVTQNHIKDLLPTNSIFPTTKAVLANAAFFKGLWAIRFNKTNTQKKLFNGAAPAEVEMMTVKDEFSYGVLEKENAAYLEMPYQGEDQAITMYVYLPLENTPNAVDDLVDTMTMETIQEAFRGEIPQEVDVQFPKMALEGNYELKNILEKMGIKNLFGSPLTGYSDEASLSFDDMVHKAKLEIDEDGSVAAAATSTMSRSMTFMQPEPVQFHCDRPFVFMINDRVSHEVLFAGVYRGPNN
ncbi:serine protease inhibitor 88Ea-like [Sitodiplosis mosellana]|uniref:serine protease inhibitor 88Ea-like n=1 Tax=Sitodiplosis mosellana TaxID=263140 RepID=UPI002444E394|nr:serine protease inhibitor 88Ea-like [Sitodiplosis mosellana]